MLHLNTYSVCSFVPPGITQCVEIATDDDRSDDDDDDDDHMIYKVAATGQRELSESETKRLTSALSMTESARTQTQLNVGVIREWEWEREWVCWGAVFRIVRRSRFSRFEIRFHLSKPASYSRSRSCSYSHSYSLYSMH